MEQVLMWIVIVLWNFLKLIIALTDVLFSIRICYETWRLVTKKL